MKTVKRLAAALFALLLSLSLAGAAYAANGYVPYALDDVDMTVWLPNDMYAITRGISEDDPALRAFGYTLEDAEAKLAEIGLLYAASPEFDWFMSIDRYPIPSRSYDDYSGFVTYILSQSPKVKYRWIDSRLFGRRDMTLSDGDAVLIYTTVIGEDEVVLSFSGELTEELEARWEDIISRVEIGEGRAEDGRFRVDESIAQAEADTDDPIASGKDVDKAPASAPPPGTIYVLGDAGLSIELSDELYVFTRDMAEDDPVFARSGTDASIIRDLFGSDDLYLLAYAPDFSWRAILMTSQGLALSEYGDLALLLPEQLKFELDGAEGSYAQRLFGSLSSDGDDGEKIVEGVDGDAVRIGDYSYYRAQYSSIDAYGERTEKLAYLTAYGGVTYCFMLATEDPDADLLTLGDEMLSSVRFINERKGRSETPRTEILQAALRYGIRVVTAIIGLGICAIGIASTRKKKKAAAAPSGEPWEQAREKDPWER